MMAALVLLLGVGPTAGGSLTLAGEGVWTEPLGSMLATRLGMEVRSESAASGVSDWHVRLGADPEPRCLRLEIRDPDGVTAEERWCAPVDAPSHEMATRSLAAWLAAVVRREIDIAWSPRAPRIPVVARLEEAPEVPSGPPWQAGVGIGGVADLQRRGCSPRTACSMAVSLHLRREIADGYGFSGGIALELPNTVGMRTVAVGRWSLPLQVSVSRAFVRDPWWADVRVGLAARVLHLEPPRETAVERFALGASGEALVGLRLGRVLVGGMATLLVWTRRQRLRYQGKIVHEVSYFQLLGGVYAGVDF